METIKNLYDLNKIYRFEVELKRPGGNIERYLDEKIGKEGSRFLYDLDILQKRESLFIELKNNFDSITSKGSYDYLTKEEILFANEEEISFYKINIFEEKICYLNNNPMKKFEYLVADTVNDFLSNFLRLPKDDDQYMNLTDSKRLGKSNFSCFIIDKNDNLYIFPYRSNTIHHTYITKNEPVKMAGMIRIENGKICYIDNKSGHYCPNPDGMLVFFDCLKKLNNMNDIKHLFHKKFCFERDSFSDNLIGIVDNQEWGINLLNINGVSIDLFFKQNIREKIKEKYFLTTDEYFDSIQLNPVVNCKILATSQLMYDDLTFKNTINVDYLNIPEIYKSFLEEKSILLCEEFMNLENIDKLLIVGGSILKNNLDIKPIDDYDIKIIGTSDELIKIVNNLITNKKWISKYENVFIRGTSSSKSIYCPLTSPEPQNYLFDIGCREETNLTQITPFLLESFAIKLEKKDGNIRRIILDMAPLEQLLNNKLDMMQSPIDNPFDLYRIIQRFFVTTMKYNIKEEEKQKAVEKILEMNGTINAIDEFESSKINSIRKLFMLLNRINQKHAENYLQELSKTNILQECFRDWQKFMDNLKVKNKIVFDCNNSFDIYNKTRKIIEDNIIGLSKNIVKNSCKISK